MGISPPAISLPIGVHRWAILIGGSMTEGWVKLYRQSIEHEWLKNHKLWAFWSYCLLKASHKEYTAMIGFQRVEIKSGQFIFGRSKTSEELNMSEQNIRTCIGKLKSAGNITIKSTNKYSIVTLTNWEKFQGEDVSDNQQLTNNQPTTNQQLTTYKNNKNVKNVKKEEKNLSCVRFEEFWKQYPSSRRVDKKACRRKWMTEKLDDKIDKILAGLENHKQSEQWSDEQYIPHAKTWLNQERWETEMNPKSETSTQLQLSPPLPETKT